LKALPWTKFIPGLLGPASLLPMSGLAVINVFLPLAILRLAARRRPWTVRLLLAVPVAAAIPLTAFVTLEPTLREQSDGLALSPKVQFALGTLAAIPVVLYAATIVISVHRHRWRGVLVLISLAVFIATAVAACWLLFDMQFMPAIEHYNWSELWHGNLVPPTNLMQLPRIAR
jgi:hypothetical protein